MDCRHPRTLSVLRKLPEEGTSLHRIAKEKRKQVKVFGGRRCEDTEIITQTPPGRHQDLLAKKKKSILNVVH